MKKELQVQLVIFQFHYSYHWFLILPVAFQCLRFPNLNHSGNSLIHSFTLQFLCLPVRTGNMKKRKVNFVLVFKTWLKSSRFTQQNSKVIQQDINNVCHIQFSMTAIIEWPIYRKKMFLELCRMTFFNNFVTFIMPHLKGSDFNY